MIELRQLRALLAIEDFKSFSLAAQALSTVQSNISAHLARLEDTVGAVLVDRRNGDLTEEGHAVAIRARRLFAELEAIDSDISALRNDVRGRVRIGMIGTVARWFVPVLLEELTIRHPNLQVEIAEGTTSALEARVHSNAFEFAIMTKPLNSDELIFKTLFEEGLVLITTDNHPLAGRTSITVTDLDNIPILLPPRGTQFRDQVEQVAKLANVILTPKAEIDGVRLLVSMAFDGFAPTIAPASAVPTVLADRIGVVKIEGLPPRRVGVTRRTKVQHSAAAKAVLAVIDSFFTGHDSKLQRRLPSGIHSLL